MFLRFLKGTHFGKLPTEYERSDPISKIIKHVTYSIKYCKISLLIYSGSCSLSNAGNFFYSPGILVESGVSEKFKNFV